MYDLTYRKPKSLLERFDTFEVTERSKADGSIHAPLDEDDAREVALEIRNRGYEAVAVTFLHSYANPAHEKRMGEILAEVAPEVEVTMSHELSREYREYERTSTTVLDAYIKPIMRNYLKELETELAARGFDGQFLMSRSGGGAMTAAAAREQPVNLILSGPAGGVIGAAGFAELIGRKNAITIDMGGTSLDASLVLDGAPVHYHGAEFEGLPINTPSLYIHTIGAGGGSLGYLDEAGALQVGPKSAGADPGPAAYNRGGTEPTFTDAALAIGYLGTDTPLGGELVLDVEKSRQALNPIAEALNVRDRVGAPGMVRISNTKITGAVRAITIELGHDPKDFSLFSFGGGGGLVAVDVARELGIPEVVVPPGQGAFSALGMLMADVQHEYSRTQVALLDSIDLGSIERRFPADGVGSGYDLGNGRVRTRATWYSNAPSTFDTRGRNTPSRFRFPKQGTSGSRSDRSSKRLHRKQYGHVMDDAVEVTTLRVTAIGIVEKPNLPTMQTRETGAVPARTRTVILPGDEACEYALIAREDLLAGDSVEGPAVITEHTATTVLHVGDRLSVGEFGELVISIQADSAQPAPNHGKEA